MRVRLKSIIKGARAAAAILLLAGCSRASREADKADDLANTAGYVRQTLPLEKNAYHLWTNAMSRALPPRDAYDLRDALLAAAEFKTNLAEFAQSARRLPKGSAYAGSLHSNMTCVADCPELVEWLDSRAGVLQEIDAGLSLGRMQFPLVTQSNVTDVIRISGLIDLARLKLVAGRRATECGDSERAAQAFFDVMRMGEMIMSGEGGLIAFSVGSCLKSESGMRGLRWLSMRLRSDGPALRRMLARLPSPPVEDFALAEACRVEVNSTVSRGQMERLTESVAGDPKSCPIRFSRVFSASDTARLGQDLLSRIATNALSSWSARDKDVSAELANRLNMSGLPQKLREDFFSELALAHMTSDERQKAADTKKLWMELEKAGRHQPNLFGVMLLESSMHCAETAHRTSVKARCQVSLLRASLALMICKAEKGVYPRSMDDAVSRNIFADLPLDFFSGRAIRYSADRCKLWSVGADEVDDQRDDKKDIVWKLPE